jgi:hypothetical protein
LDDLVPPVHRYLSSLATRNLTSLFAVVFALRATKIALRTDRQHRPQSFGLPGSLAERYDAHEHGDARGGAVTSLVERPRAPDLAPQRERSLELDPDLRPRLGALLGVFVAPALATRLTAVLTRLESYKFQTQPDTAMVMARLVQETSLLI